MIATTAAGPRPLLAWAAAVTGSGADDFWALAGLELLGLGDAVDREPPVGLGFPLESAAGADPEPELDPPDVDGLPPDVARPTVAPFPTTPPVAVGIVSMYCWTLGSPEGGGAAPATPADPAAATASRTTSRPGRRREIPCTRLLYQRVGG